MYDELTPDYKNAFSQGDIGQIQRIVRNLIGFHAVSKSAFNTVYEQSFPVLKNSPDLKPFVLEIVRKKYTLFRNNGSPTIYDESVIMNDLSAAL